MLKAFNQQKLSVDFLDFMNKNMTDSQALAKELKKEMTDTFESLKTSFLKENLEQAKKFQEDLEKKLKSQREKLNSRQFV